VIEKKEKHDIGVSEKSLVHLCGNPRASETCIDRLLPRDTLSDPFQLVSPSNSILLRTIHRAIDWKQRTELTAILIALFAL
jgi:hypothetical protein